MATKTISIDLEAYDLLARRKRAGQSFSQVIKEHLGPPKTARALLEALPGIARGISPEALQAYEEALRLSRRDRARAPRL